MRDEADLPRSDPTFTWSVRALLAITWLAMVWGAATRASRAGVSCPDWPLCHGHLIPPADATAYPANPLYEVHRVFLEFTHRILASLVACGAIALALWLFRQSRRRSAFALLTVLVAQVVMGAVTVLLRNAPVTVVIHLALALTLVAIVLGATARPSPRTVSFDAAWKVTAALVVVQLLIGGVVSSRELGLACFDFPMCNGFPIPIYWNAAIAWQFAHRFVGLTVLLAAFALAVTSFGVRASRDERRYAVTFAAAVVLQVLLGACNVWFRIPPTISALHLGVAVIVFALATRRALPAATPKTPQVAPRAVGEVTREATT